MLFFWVRACRVPSKYSWGGGGYGDTGNKNKPASHPAPEPSILVGCSWYLLTNDNCTYNCPHNHIGLKGLISGL